MAEGVLLFQGSNVEQGYIKLFRQIQDNALWKEKPFNRGGAWVDLLLLANHKDGGYWLRGIWVEVKRGEVGWSQIRLAKRWGWSRDKVRRFLKYLKNESQIAHRTIQQNKRLTSLIIIIKYEEYQSNDTTNKTTDDTTIRQETDKRQGSNKNDKNDKNDKKKIYGKFKNVRLTEKEVEELKKEFGENKATEWIETLSEGMALKTYKYKSHYLAILKWSKNKKNGEFSLEEQAERLAKEM